MVSHRAPLALVIFFAVLPELHAQEKSDIRELKLHELAADALDAGHENDCGREIRCSR